MLLIGSLMFLWRRLLHYTPIVQIRKWRCREVNLSKSTHCCYGAWIQSLGCLSLQCRLWRRVGDSVHDHVCTAVQSPECGRHAIWDSGVRLTSVGLERRLSVKGPGCFSKDPILVPRTHFGQLSTTCISSFKASETSGLCRHLPSHMHPQIPFIKNNINL